MSEPGFWVRVRTARIIPILVVYLAACWAVLQGVDALREAFSLPGWVRPVAAALLLIGLLVVTATAWIQAHPLTKARKAQGEIPGTWELAPRALVGELVAGEVPHLTWARSILGGVFALVLLFLLAGLAALFHHVDGRVLEPEPTGEGGSPKSAPVAFLAFERTGKEPATSPSHYDQLSGIGEIGWIILGADPMVPARPGARGNPRPPVHSRREDIMPTYDYICQKCGRTFQRVEKISEHGQKKPRCPACKSPRVERVFSSVFVKTRKKS